MSIFPDELPLLALRGIVLMPRSYLPIPIVDASQAAMVADCLQTKGKANWDRPVPIRYPR